MLGVINVYNNNLISKGLKPGVKLISINGHKISDQFDLFFYSDDRKLQIEFLNSTGEIKKLNITPKQLAKVEFEPLKPKKCGAHCIFCFVEQLPKGLRKSLYHKDEDYRFSYLYGNYVALTNITDYELKKIVRYRLSPLYISVHTTDPVLRGNMLGLKKAAPILPYIRFLAKNSISLHCQIVLCPGVNDGNMLEKTINDLSEFYPNVESVAIVPVGLTAHREKLYHLRPFNAKLAKDLIKQLKPIQNRFLKTFGNPFVFLSDEFYILSKTKIPDKEHYFGFPQIENGVGITRQVIEDAEKLLKKRLQKDILSGKKIALVTGVIAYKVLLPYVNRLKKLTNLHIDLYAVENKLLGKTVTVTGLLSGKDIIQFLQDKKFDILFIPNVMLKDKKDTFLDDVTISDLRRFFNTKVYTFKPLLSEFYKKIVALAKHHNI